MPHAQTVLFWLCISLTFVCLAHGSTYSILSYAALDRLAVCAYDSRSGLFDYEDMWQAGNTIETIANHMSLLSPQAPEYLRLWGIINNTYSATKDIIDNCYDDHQWWLLAWIRAFEVTKDRRFLTRAGVIFDNTVANAWTDYQCGGGVVWCPISKGQNGYKNAITNELFLASSIGLHPYASLLGHGGDNYYLNWAVKEWKWFAASGMINSQSLVNDGLNNQCGNNGQTTWTYNQGVLLDAAVKIAGITNDRNALIQVVNIIQSVMQHLTSNGILQEPCSSCDGDQIFFKGIFIRHLMYTYQQRNIFNSLGVAFPTNAVVSFIVNNVESMLKNSQCLDSGYGADWGASCQNENTATTSAATDLLLAAAAVSPSSTSSASTWEPIGLGNCEDNSGTAMSNCNSAGSISEEKCQSTANTVQSAMGYDFYMGCNKQGTCRIRTLGSSCPSGWTFERDGATQITKSNGNSLTLCRVQKQ